MRIIRSVITICALSIVTACAQVPKQSVELSTTIGRDLDSIHQSHRELAEVLFARMERDVDRFIDTVYAPYQIRSAMEYDAQLAKSADTAQQQRSLLRAINEAYKPEASSQLQEAVLRSMGHLVQKIHDDVESKRAELIEPIKAEEKQVVGAIDRSYQQVHYANSVVTGYLASVVKVNEAQKEILHDIGVDKDLNKQIGESLAKASEDVAVVVDKAQKADNSLGQAQKSAQKIKDSIIQLRDKLKKANKEV